MDVVDAACPAVAVAPEQPRAKLQRHGLAVLVGSGVMYALLIHNGVGYDGEWSPTDESIIDFLFYGSLYLLLGGGWLLLSLRFISRETLAALNLNPGTLWDDARAGAQLCLTTIMLSALAAWVVYSLPGYTETAAAQDMSDTNHMGLAMLLATTFYDWTAAALFEEFLRTFTISRLLKFGDPVRMRQIAVAVTTILFACYHLYYGVYGAMTVAVIGLIFGLHYVKHGRVLPLVFAHGLFNMWSTFADLYS